MATSAICMVKTIRLQKPSPKDLATTCGLEPLTSAARATTTTARAANTKASGNQRSAQPVKRRPSRVSMPSSLEPATRPSLEGRAAMAAADGEDVGGMGLSCGEKQEVA